MTSWPRHLLGLLLAVVALCLTHQPAPVFALCNDAPRVVTSYGSLSYTDAGTGTSAAPATGVELGPERGHGVPHMAPVTSPHFVVAAKSADEIADIGHAGIHQFPDTLPRKSQFFDDIDLGSLSSRTKGMDGILQPNGNARFVLRNPGGVGVDRTTGLPTDIFTVIRRPDGSVVTMFPGTSPKG